MTNKVAHIFNEMRDEYDDLSDLWYSWLFSRLHYMIAKMISDSDWDRKKKEVLDIGCGTGFQSFIYAVAGAKVTGMDISEDLISVARQKAENFEKKFPVVLFSSYFDFVDRYNKLISEMLEKKFNVAQYVRPEFIVADALQIPSVDNAFDHVNCCGSTLSFVQNHNAALAEMSRVLRADGTFMIEVEAKYNPDIIWTILNSFLFGRLDYETRLGDAVKAAFSKPRSHVYVEYPFGDIKNPVYMNIKLFVKSTLIKELERHNLKTTKTFTIHSLTNCIPSTMLDTSAPSGFLTKAFFFLAKLEEYCPFALPGCSLVLVGRKEPTKTTF